MPRRRGPGPRHPTGTPGANAADRTRTAIPSSPPADPITGASPRRAHGGFLGALPSGPLVGRESELRRVLAALDAVAGGQGRLVLLAGEPGVGKTRLAQEMMLRAQERGFRVLAGRCYEHYASLPFFPFVEALTSAPGPGLAHPAPGGAPALPLPGTAAARPDREPARARGRGCPLAHPACGGRLPRRAGRRGAGGAAAGRPALGG